jgi:DNA (cytosine-5)-methyltransferase 1
VNELALFAGAGGGILGGQLLGWRTVCAVEREAYPAAVLAQRQNDGLLPAFPIWSDVTTFDGRPWRGIVDVVSGGFPCQAYSNAAAGKNNARCYWGEMLKVIGDVRPRFVWAENVSEDAILKAQEDLQRAGYNTRRAKVSSADVGGDHIRARFWLLGYTNYGGKPMCDEHDEAQGMQELLSSVWKSDPRELRISDEVAYRMDRIKSVGNGQDPLGAAEAFRRLTERLA